MTAYNLNNYDITTTSFATLSSLCAILTLYLLWDLGKWTGFAGLVCALTLSQLVYDVGFYVKPAAVATGQTSFAYYMLQITGGLATTLLTNVMSYIVVVIAMSLRSYNIKSNFASILSVVGILSIVPAMLASMGDSMQLGSKSLPVFNAVVLYYYPVVRVLSILFNFACYLVLCVRLRAMGWSFSLAEAAKSGHPVHPVCALAARMVYYPCVQVLTRLPAAWLEFGYDLSIEDDAQWTAATSTPAYQIANTLYCISGPSAGIGFLIIFLLMQPSAYRHLVARFWTCTDPRSQQHQTGAEHAAAAAAAAAHSPAGPAGAYLSEGGTLHYPSYSYHPLPGQSHSHSHGHGHGHSPSARAQAYYREVLPSINDETPRHTSSERSSEQSDRDRDRERLSADKLEDGGLAGGVAGAAGGGGMSFASRSSHYWGASSYNIHELDDDELAALVDRCDSGEYNRTFAAASASASASAGVVVGSSQQSPSLLSGLVESFTSSGRAAQRSRSTQGAGVGGAVAGGLSSSPREDGFASRSFSQS